MNQVAQNKEYGLIAATFFGQMKWIVTGAVAVVCDGQVHYIREETAR